MSDEKEVFLKYFLRFRNDHGEVVVCVIARNKSVTILPAGFAFCNPLDFNHRRENRVRAGHGIAAKRAERGPGAPGSYNIILPDAIGKIDRGNLFGVIKERVIDVLRRKSTSDDLFGFPPYRGEGEGDFAKWIDPFCTELTS